MPQPDEQRPAAITPEQAFREALEKITDIGTDKGVDHRAARVAMAAIARVELGAQERKS